MGVSIYLASGQSKHLQSRVAQGPVTRWGLIWPNMGWGNPRSLVSHVLLLGPTGLEGCKGRLFVGNVARNRKGAGT